MKDWIISLHMADMNFLQSELRLQIEYAIMSAGKKAIAYDRSYIHTEEIKWKFYIVVQEVKETL